jgi:VIT1/CCC1 family predicted Fe2+/Mn2+ transporter
MPGEELSSLHAPAASAKEELEKQKLTEELRRLHSVRWRASAFLGGIVPIATSMIALLIATASVVIPLRLGVFNVEQKNLEVKKLLLEYDTRKLTEERLVSSNALTTLRQAVRVADSVRASLTNENQQLRRMLTDLRRERSNEVAQLDNTTNKIASLVLKELKRIETERDLLATTNRALLAQLNSGRAFTADSTKITADSSRRITEDGTYRETEDGTPRTTEREPIILTDANGVPLTQPDGTVFIIGYAELASRATNSPPKTNAAPRPQ